MVNDLNIIREGCTFISYEHSGLITIVKQLIPLVEYKHCVCHIYQNLTKNVKVDEDVKIVQYCTRATTMTQYNMIMNELKGKDVKT